MRRISCFLLISSILGSTGCSTLNENFDCPASLGGSCKRMDEIYDELNGANKYKLRPVHIHKDSGSMKVWVAPFKDTAGNYHPAKSIYSPLQEA